MQLKVLSEGWLLKDDRQSWEVFGVPVDPATRTRREEYHWAATHTTGACVLDAATGYVPTWHMLPYILANCASNRVIVACDMDARQRDMPPHPRVIRLGGDITRLPFLDNQFDTVCCISTLEHLPLAEQAAAARELYRVTKPGGEIILTADLAPWLPTLFGLPHGPEAIPEPSLAPPVYALAMRKLA